MSDKPEIGILGAGYCLPPTIRTNDDPIFQWLRDHPAPGQDLFQGYDQRHVLADGEKLIDLMVSAAQQALEHAGIGPAEIGAVLGYGSVSEYLTPNLLADLHRRLKLGSQTWILPLNDEFTVINTSLLVAHKLIETGQIEHALIVCGSNWTRHVDYHTSPSISVGDGAGVLVMGRLRNDTQFAYVDSETEIQSGEYGSMYLRADPLTLPPAPGTDDPRNAYTSPVFHLTAEGAHAFVNFGEFAPPRVANRLLGRYRLTGDDIVLMSHQASSVLMDQWTAAIRPAQYVNTLQTFGNMTLATLPVNFAYAYNQLDRDHMMFLCLGLEMQTTSTLLRRRRA